MHCVRYAAGLTVVVVVGLLVGCGGSGPKRYPVSGTVKYKGELVKAGTITFRSESGEAASAPITDGQYSMSSDSGLPAGTYKVAISYPDPKAVPARPEDAKPRSLPPDLLPAEYNVKTKLTAEIKAQGSNDVSFDLK